MSIEFKRLTIEMIDRCPEIQAWLNQFPGQKRSAAITLLLQLQFVSRDVYAEWLKTTLLTMSGRCALYSVRKLDEANPVIWDTQGEVVRRPSASQGSEDFVQSVIAGLMKAERDKFLDHPGLNALCSGKIRDIILLDDSIGSGDRVGDFVRALFSSKTFLSWWSFGLIHLHIVAFARFVEAEARIIEKVPGSDHPVRKKRKSEKITFLGPFAYQESRQESRWGSGFKMVSELCDTQTEIPALFSRGWGGVMANLIFYHSVPDNIPGMLWSEQPRWTPLLPNRSVPEWLPQLLEGATVRTALRSTDEIPTPLLDTLLLLKRGIRNVASLAHRSGIATSYMEQLVEQGRRSGLISDQNRLTEAGVTLLHRRLARGGGAPFDRSLYVPKFWCAGRATVQPSVLAEATQRRQADSDDGKTSNDGGVGQIPLARTDAKTAPPSLGIIAQQPSKPREGHDAHGPLG